MPRKTPKTGSELFGRELRRMRGGRSLDDIFELSQQEPLCHYVEPIAAPTLSQLETGTTLPKLTTLHTLSVIYKTSMSQLMSLVVEDRLAGKGVKLEFETKEVAKAEFDRLVSLGEWHRALPIAINGERLANDERTRVTWRGNRATCLSRMGLHQEGVAILLDLSELPSLEPMQRYQIVRNLADAYRAGGYLNAAASTIHQAILLAQQLQLDAHGRALLDWTRASLMVEAHANGLSGGDATLREALAHLDEASGNWSTADPLRDAWIGLIRGAAYLELGNALAASADLEKVRRIAAREGSALLEGHATLLLATALMRRGAHDQALAHLAKAASLAEADRQYLLLFEVSLEQFKLLRKTDPGRAVKFLRKCRSLYPLLTSRSPVVREFEVLTRDLA